MTLCPVIDTAACAGHGDCADIAPDVFRVDDVAVVIGTADDDTILDAAEACPSGAITVRDDATGEVVYP
jgi:ferredoxin